MPRYRSTRPFASLRNLEMYHVFTCAGYTQAELAERLGISQRRVSAIACQVRNWVERKLDGIEYHEHPNLRFHYAVLHEHERIRQLFCPFLRSVRGLLRRAFAPNHDDAAMQGPASADEMRQDKDLLDKALGVLNALAALEVMISRGPFAQTLGTAASAATVDRGSCPEPCSEAATVHQSDLKPGNKTF
jgi:transcriptional regulator with XRE-family HTH domain